MLSVLLFYRKLRKEPEEYGVTMNPYDMCVANMTTKLGDQLTVLWHVDDFKVSCKNKFEVTNLMCYRRGICGEKMTVHHGASRECLDMLLDFTEPKVFQADMSKYVKEILKDCHEEIKKSSPPLHTYALFTVKEGDNTAQLAEELAV
jgi:hypothetical protein